MAQKDTTPNATGFYIWFDKEKKKEYYSVPLTLYRAKLHKCKNSNYSYVSYTPNYLPKVSPKRNKANYIKNVLKLKLLDLNNPYEERYGMFLLNFLNARFNKYENAYKDFFYAYSYELLDVATRKLKLEYKDESDYLRTTKAIFEAKQEEIVALQKEFRECIDYVYNLNGNNADVGVDPSIKFQAYSMAKDFSKYAQRTYIHFSNLSIFKSDFAKVQYNQLTQTMNGSNPDFNGSVKYKSYVLSNICFIVLNHLISNSAIIKTCKHCGRYFIPVNRNNEIYCDLTPRDVNGKKCRELGARLTYNQNIQEVEGLLIYRRTYQRRLMELSRNDNATEKEKSAFNNWKKAAQEKIKEYKSGNITEDELNVWMRENKDL